MKRKSFGKEVLLQCIILLMLGFGAQAVPITIQISGNVTSANGSGLPDTIYAGVNFTGAYTYESSMEDSDVNPNYGIYEYDSPYGLSLSLGGYEFRTTLNHINKFEIRITNDDPQANLWDYYIAESDEIVSIPPASFEVNHIRWVLGDITHTALGSDNLPVTAPVLTNWNYNVLQIYSNDGLGHILSIEGIVTQAVPEPLTSLLILAGVFLVRSRQ